MRRGLLIAFEGIDGTGKSTQLRLLAEYLRTKGFEVIETCEPTNGPYGQQIRKLYRNRRAVDLDEELQLFVDDRKEHVEQVIAPALARGAVVLTDRYYFSSAAYQGAAGGDVAAIFAANRFAPEPDLVLLMALDPAKALERIWRHREEPPNDFEQLDQLKRVSDLFASFAHSFITTIDADQTVAEVQVDVRSAVDDLLRRWTNSGQNLTNHR